jgi:hypothetical protein
VKRILPTSLTVMMLVFCLALYPGLVGAAPITLTDLNSSVTIDPDSQAGAAAWSVDGVDQLYQQWFWYRIGSTGGESSIDTISAASVNVVGRVADIGYANDLLSVEITYTLTGGTAGSGTSDLAETIRIINLSDAAISLHFFQYSDFDLGGSAEGDSVNILSKNTVDQTDGVNTLSETVVGPPSNHYEAAVYSATLDSLNDGSPTTLSDNATAGPDDVTWAFEWDVTIGAGSTFIISKDKRIAPVPLPPAALLMGSGLIGLLGLGYKKNRA